MPVHAELEQHRRRHLAGERALGLPVAVLREDADLRPASACTAAERDERRADDDVDVVRQLGVAQRAAEGARLGGPLNIFQLPAISIRQTGSPPTPGKLLALEQLERRAAAGRDPRDAVGDARLVDGADRVAAADDGEAVAAATAPARPRTCPRRTAATRRRPSGRSRRPSSRGLRSGARSRSRVSGPMSSPSQPSGSASNGVTCVSASSANDERGDDVGREHDRKRERVLARTSSAILPPISTSSARPPRFSSTPILSSTFAPPETITNGRSTSPSRRPRCSSSASSRRPAYAGSSCATPTVEACARCAEPNASLT